MHVEILCFCVLSTETYIDLLPEAHDPDIDIRGMVCLIVFSILYNVPYRRTRIFVGIIFCGFKRFNVLCTCTRMFCVVQPDNCRTIVV